MPRGVKGKRKVEKVKPAPQKPLGVWVWAQCDNAGCQKWRKLPPGTVIDDTEPWFCYMNPNGDQNDCNIPEEDYDVATEAAVYSHPVSDDEGPATGADRSWTPASKLASRQKPRSAHQNGRAPSRRGRRKNGYSDSTLFLKGLAGTPRTDSPADRAPLDPALQDPRAAGRLGAAFAEGRDGGAKSVALQRELADERRALENFGRIITGGATEGAGPDADVDGDGERVWEDLAAHAPEAASLACQAADTASAASYFSTETPAAAQQAAETASLARLSLAAAAAVAHDSAASVPGVVPQRSVPDGGATATPQQTSQHRPPWAAAAGLQTFGPAWAASGPFPQFPLAGQMQGGAHGLPFQHSQGFAGAPGGLAFPMVQQTSLPAGSGVPWLQAPSATVLHSAPPQNWPGVPGAGLPQSWGPAQGYQHPGGFHSQPLHAMPVPVHALATGFGAGQPIPGPLAPPGFPASAHAAPFPAPVKPRTEP